MMTGLGWAERASNGGVDYDLTMGSNDSSSSPRALCLFADEVRCDKAHSAVSPPAN